MGDEVGTSFTSCRSHASLGDWTAPGPRETKVKVSFWFPRCSLHESFIEISFCLQSLFVSSSGVSIPRVFEVF